MKTRILDKYLAKQITAMILIVALALVGFDLFFNLVQELKMVGRGDYTVVRALAFLFLTMPSRLYSLFPWAALIGSLIALGALGSRSELVVMRTAAMSIAKIVRSVLKAAMVLIVAVVFMGEVLAPALERYAQSKKTLYLSAGQSIQTSFGMWIKQGENFLQVQTIDSEGVLHGLTWYQFDKRQLKEALYAQSAYQKGEKWYLQDVRGTRFLPGQTQTFNVAKQEVQHLLDAEVLETARVKHPERLSLPMLWRVMHHKSTHELNTQSYELAFWVKLLQPVVILVMVFLAVPFVFGPLRSKSMGFKIVTGILVAFSFHTLNHLFAPLAIVYQWPPLIAVLGPILLFSGIGFWLLHRVK